MRMTAYAGFMDKRINDLLTALSEPTRLRALQIIWDGDEHCVCELMDRLGATQSRMSRHMARLKASGLLTDRRDTQWVRYRRNPDLPAASEAIVDAILSALPALPPAQRQKKAA
jgi:ArsR family transcriptional regulator